MPCPAAERQVGVQARQQAKEMVWMKQSENMVLEAMAHLSAVHDVLEEMLLGAHSIEAGPQIPDMPRRDSDALQVPPLDRLSTAIIEGGGQDVSSRGRWGPGHSSLKALDGVSALSAAW